MQAAKKKKIGVSGCSILCNLTQVTFDLIRSAWISGLSVSVEVEVVCKKCGFSAVDTAQAGGLQYFRIREMGVTWLMRRRLRLSSPTLVMCAAAWLRIVVHWRTETRLIVFYG